MLNPDLFPHVQAVLLGLCAVLLLLAVRAAALHARARHEATALAEEVARLRTVLADAEAAQAALSADLSSARQEAHSQRVRADEASTRAAVLEAEAERDRREIETLHRDSAALRDARTDAQDHIAELREALARKDTELRAAARHSEDTLTRVTDMREQMETRFRELAEASVREQGTRLSDLSREQLTNLLTPLKEHIGRFETELRGVHKKADEERSLLKQEIGQLTERSRQLSDDAQSLAKALRGDSQKQGAWGEMVLVRLLEASGLIEGTHYETQVSVVTEDNRRLRPDVLVHLPENRKLVIDSKVSLVAYERALASDDPAEASRALSEHIASLRAHITGLSGKSYQQIDGSQPDYVVMFVPIEGALSEALRVSDDLTTFALERNVTIATPTTLIMALRTIHHVWQIDTRNKNAETIAQEAGRLYDKLAGFTENLDKVGRALAQAVSAHENAVGQLSTGRGNALAKAEKIKKMGAKTGAKALAYEADPEEANGEGEDDGPLTLLPGGRE